MAGNWGASIAIHFPRPPLRGTASFDGETVVTAGGIVFFYTFAAAAFVGDTTFAANAILAYAGSAAFSGDTTLSASGSIIRPTIYHVIISGQSNGAGTGGGIGYSTTPIGKGRKFVGGERPGVVGLSSFVTYTGADVTCDGQSIGESLCYYLGEKIPGNATILISNVAVGGYRLANVSKNTPPYNNSITQMTYAKLIADSLGADYRVLAICILNGEAEYALSYTGDYGVTLIQFVDDYNADIQLVNPGNPVVRVYSSQINSSSSSVDQGPSHDANRRLYERSISDPSKVVLCGGNRSHYERYDILHLAATGQRKIGEMYARAIVDKEFLGTWAPFYVVSAVRTGVFIDVTFSCPYLPIRMDYDTFASSGADNVIDGFSFFDDSNSAKVVDVEITSSNTLRLSLSQTPTGTNPRITYGYTNNGNGEYTPRVNGQGGPLSDSRLTGLRYPELANPCPSFDVPVTT